MKKGKQPRFNVRYIRAEGPVEKADTSVQLQPEEENNAGDWLKQPYDLKHLRYMVENSTILPQCIRAYKNNICGFGIGVKYRDDVEETKEMAAEYDQMQAILELLNTDQDTKEVFEDLVEARETYGIAYLEVVRSLAGGEVVHIDFVKDVPDVTKTKPLDPYIETPYYHKGVKYQQKKKYCKYRQIVGGKTRYWKEFGDPRIMDLRDGHYLGKGETIEPEFAANELLEFAIGTHTYGEVRWMGQSLGIDGAHRAENLNNAYFIHGRHTPLLIILKNGTLSDDSFHKLKQYTKDIEGDTGAHGWLILEMEATDNRTDFETTEKADVEIKDLASVLQKDELFQDYMENHRKKVQSSFLLPDLYTGYTTDFNRATAQTAQEVTEKQVFQPERKSLAWAINNKLLNGYNFKYCEAYFMEPNISNPDDTYKMLSVLRQAGGLTMNKAKELTWKLYGETAEDYEADWGDLPYEMAQKANAGPEESSPDFSSLIPAVEATIQKAAANRDDEIVAVMKEIRKYLKGEQNAVS